MAAGDPRTRSDLSRLPSSLRRVSRECRFRGAVEGRARRAPSTAPGTDRSGRSENTRDNRLRCFYIISSYSVSAVMVAVEARYRVLRISMDIEGRAFPLGP